jgi:rRNA maturation protein Rpf1
MTILKAETFSTPGRLALFINENKIVPANILVITDGTHGPTIYFYADSEVKEITHGLFS